MNTNITLPFNVRSFSNIFQSITLVLLIIIEATYVINYVNIEEKKVLTATTKKNKEYKYNTSFDYSMLEDARLEINKKITKLKEAGQEFVMEFDDEYGKDKMRKDISLFMFLSMAYTLFLFITTLASIFDLFSLGSTTLYILVIVFVAINGVVATSSAYCMLSNDEKEEEDTLVDLIGYLLWVFLFLSTFFAFYYLIGGWNYGWFALLIALPLMLGAICSCNSTIIFLILIALSIGIMVACPYLIDTSYDNWFNNQFI